MIGIVSIHDLSSTLLQFTLCCDFATSHCAAISDAPSELLSSLSDF